MRVSFLFFVAFFLTVASCCQDIFDSKSCSYWKQVLDYCNHKDGKRSCAKTCGFCNGPTDTPTSMKPTTKSITEPATKPIVTTSFPTDIPSSGPSNRHCGVSTVQQSRIVNGVDAKPGAWPWIASIQEYGGHFCGGTLISPRWVLTASHCVERMGRSSLWKFSVNLGVHVRTEIESTEQKMNIKRVIKHPDYKKKTLDSDMALLELTKPVQLNDRVVLACMPKHNIYPPLGKQCYLAGWGSIKHPGSPHHTLQQTRLPVVDQVNCHNKREVVCVGKGKKDQPDGKQQPNACRGDSGGPLVCQQSDGRWQLEGVASYVYTYCKYYTAYSPVNKYLSWIQQYVKDL